VFKDLCAVILLGVLGMTFVPLSKDRADGSKVRRGGEQIEFSIRGMSCEHCVQAVRTALLACSGVDAVEVSLEEGRTEVRGSGLDGNTLRRTVEQLGYTIAESNDPQIAGKGDPSSC
jgi:copper chaperone